MDDSGSSCADGALSMATGIISTGVYLLYSTGRSTKYIRSFLRCSTSPGDLSDYINEYGGMATAHRESQPRPSLAGGAMCERSVIKICNSR